MPLWWAMSRGKWRGGRGRWRWRGGLGDHVVRIGEVLWTGLEGSKMGRVIVCRLVPGRVEMSMA
jgi:hypothetical protein